MMQHKYAGRQLLVFKMGCGVTVSTRRFERFGLGSIPNSPAGAWCSGNTGDSESLVPGSIPGAPTRR